MMRDYLNNYFDSGEMPDWNDKDKDCFWDPPEPLLVGQSSLNLQNLGYMLENELKAQILSVEGSSGHRG